MKHEVDPVAVKNLSPFLHSPVLFVFFFFLLLLNSVFCISKILAQPCSQNFSTQLHHMELNLQLSSLRWAAFWEAHLLASEVTKDLESIAHCHLQWAEVAMVLSLQKSPNVIGQS
jgi:hypothetical protein